ncbi:MAG: THUMP domain-containing protein, partial [Planctomycetota bacterium]
MLADRDGGSTRAQRARRVRTRACRGGRGRCLTAHFYASCSLGLEPALASELEALGARNVRTGRGGAEFEGDRRLGYASCLWLRSAIRVQLELRRGWVRSERELYDFVRDERCEDFIGPEQTVAVDASLRDSFLTHSQYAAQLVKDAVVDRFRDRTGTRPSVDRENPDLPLRLLLRRDEAVLYADLGRVAPPALTRMVDAPRSTSGGPPPGAHAAPLPRPPRDGIWLDSLAKAAAPWLSSSRRRRMSSSKNPSSGCWDCSSPASLCTKRGSPSES